MAAVGGEVHPALKEGLEFMAWLSGTPLEFDAFLAAELRDHLDVLVDPNLCNAAKARLDGDLPDAAWLDEVEAVAGSLDRLLERSPKRLPRLPYGGQMKPWVATDRSWQDELGPLTRAEHHSHGSLSRALRACAAAEPAIYDSLSKNARRS